MGIVAVGHSVVSASMAQASKGESDMAKFLLAYKGGGMGATPEQQQQAMDAWMAWFGSLGEALIDQGSPFTPASSTISSDGTVREASTSPLTGYTIISAEGLAQANEKAKGCPVLASGGSIEVYEALPMG
jgi:hypothetical protein